ncbi:MAG: pyridoxine 5'-phosphate synthase [Phycisphaerales bacterium]|nr:pyridoxine 5'-phosphate synthase [Phycisphaerales bacterium]
MIQLGVNIDHVATVRNARYRGLLEPVDNQSSGAEPDPVRAAHEAELGGADSITVHLREDRRHIMDRDVRLLRQLVNIKLNLEMAAIDEMVEIAREIKPHTAMLVPEGRQEVTTEGGLDVAGQPDRMKSVVQRLQDAGLIVSAFIDPEIEQVQAAADAGFDVCEVHTGPYAEVFHRCGGDLRQPALQDAIKQVAQAGERISALGMRFNAGHALNFHNVHHIAALPGIDELHIGHSIVSRAVFVGLRSSVAEMKALMNRAQERSL